MGNPRPRPDRLSKKLRQIRERLGLSQSQMVTRLGLNMKASRISQYETNDREPSLKTLLEYAYAAGVHLEEIVDDDLNLPDKLPGKVHRRTRQDDTVES
jgi:transcriptional regulator with XRE-family HTH domain